MAKVKKSRKPLVISLIIIVFLMLVAVSSILLFLKIQRITESLKSSAQKATSENTPLMDE